MQILHVKIANLCLGNDLSICNNHLKELYQILLASEPYLGEVSPEYKKEIEHTMMVCDEITEVLTSKTFQDYLRSQLKVVAGGGVITPSA